MDSLKVKTINDFINAGEKPEILFWVGSAGSFDERAKTVSYTHLTLPTSVTV